MDRGDRLQHRLGVPGAAAALNHHCDNAQVPPALQQEWVALQALRVNSFGSSKSLGFVQKARSAWGTGESKPASESGETEIPEPKSSRAASKESGKALSRSNSKTSKKTSQRKWTNNWTVLDHLDGSLPELEGIWWEWQWWSPSGWSFFSSWVTEQIEKAFALGKGSCSLLHEGRHLQFDLHTGCEVNGLGRIRRIRMPCDDHGHGVSVCSTFLASNSLGSEQNTLSVWTNAM